MGNENVKKAKVNTLDEFLHGKALSLEVIVTREDKDKCALLHFIDKETGISLFDKWVRKDNLFGENKTPDNENIGGQEPYVMLFWRRIEKIVTGDFVGNMDCQLSALTLLCKFIQMNTGKLVKRRTKKPLTMSDIADALNVSVRRAAGIVADLKANGFMERKENAYFICRDCYAKGRTVKDATKGKINK